MTGNVGHKKICHIILQEIVIKIAGERFARHVRGSNLDLRSAEASRWDERFLHAPGDLHVARDLLIQFAKLILVSLDSQQRTQASEQHLGVGAFCHEVIGAGTEAVDDSASGIGAGQHQHRDVFQLCIGFDSPRQLESVQTGHSIVDDKDVRRNPFRQRESILARTCSLHGVALSLQISTDHLRVIDAVVDDKDSFRSGHR